MKKVLCYTTHLMAALLLLGLFLMSARTKVTAASSITAYDLPRIETAAQAEHQIELFRKAGWAYLLDEEQSLDQRAFILSTIENNLPKAMKSKAFEIARAVITEANHHNMDPLFLLAVIKTESRFNIKARGRHGEIGLMQILPKTAAWIAPQAGVGANFNLEDPSTNIRIGATYFAQLRKSFGGKAPRYVGAYNMGPANVYKLAAQNIEPKEYPSRVLGFYKGFYKSFSKAAITALAKNDHGRSIASARQIAD